MLKKISYALCFWAVLQLCNANCSKDGSTFEGELCSDLCKIPDQLDCARAIANDCCQEAHKNASKKDESTNKKDESTNKKVESTNQKEESTNKVTSRTSVGQDSTPSNPNLVIIITVVVVILLVIIIIGSVLLFKFRNKLCNTQEIVKTPEEGQPLNEIKKPDDNVDNSHGEAHASTGSNPPLARSSSPGSSSNLKDSIKRRSVQFKDQPSLEAYKENKKSPSNSQGSHNEYVNTDSYNSSNQPSSIKSDMKSLPQSIITDENKDTSSNQPGKSTNIPSDDDDILDDVPDATTIPDIPVSSKKRKYKMPPRQRSSHRRNNDDSHA